VDDLADYLRREAGRPFAWGDADCVTLVANWVRERRGIDPLAPWRGGYSSDDEAEEHIRQYGGGLMRSVSMALRQAGLMPTDQPQPSDVAMIALDNTQRACAIRTPKGWIVRLRDGLSLFPPAQIRLLRAWRV
jgi:hypothetical protein